MFRGFTFDSNWQKLTKLKLAKNKNFIFSWFPNFIVFYGEQLLKLSLLFARRLVLIFFNLNLNYLLFQSLQSNSIEILNVISRPANHAGNFVVLV